MEEIQIKISAIKNISLIDKGNLAGPVGTTNDFLVLNIYSNFRK